MFSKSTAAFPSTLCESVFVIAAVRVVLPWSTCPIVPMLQCGLFLSNLAFAILNVLLKIITFLGNLPDLFFYSAKFDYISNPAVFQVLLRYLRIFV